MSDDHAARAPDPFDGDDAADRQADTLPVAAAAALIGVSPAALLRAIDRGRIAAIRSATGPPLIRRAEVARLALPAREAPAPAPARDPAVAVLVIPMAYEGWATSKNGQFNGGDRKRGKTGDAIRWQRRIAESVQGALLARGATPALPLHIDVATTFRDRNHATDPHNLVELIADAVQTGTGINDRDYSILTRAPDYGAAEPTVTITVTCATARRV